MGAKGKEPNPPHRPTAYRPEFDLQAYKTCLLNGDDDKALAKRFGVCEATINNWKIKHPSFLESVRAGKELADEEVALSLRDRAIGGLQTVKKSHKVKRGSNNEDVVIVEETVYIPADTQAAKFWLGNRNPARWRERVEVDNQHTFTQMGSVTIGDTKLSFDIGSKKK